MGWVKLSQRHVERPTWRLLTGPTVARSVRAAVLAVACGLLVSCGGEPRLAPPAGSSRSIVTNRSDVVAGTPVVTAVATRMSDIVWATATDPATNAPVEPVSSYRPDARRIIAAVHVDALMAGSIIEATWEYNDTSLDAFTTQLRPSDNGADQWISFYIERNPEVEWPVGTYEVTVSLGGTTLRQAAVEVRAES